MAKSKYPTIQLFNPYSEEHLMMLLMYESKNGKSTKANEYIEKIRRNNNEIDYHSSKKTSNEIEEIVFIEEQSEMIENCYIHGYKDIKYHSSIAFDFKPMQAKFNGKYYYNYEQEKKFLEYLKDFSEYDVSEITGIKE